MIQDPPVAVSPSSLRRKCPSSISLELKDYEVLSPIGSGSFGTVFKVKKTHNNHEYALKVIFWHSFF